MHNKERVRRTKLKEWKKKRKKSKGIPKIILVEEIKNGISSKEVIKSMILRRDRARIWS